VNNTIFIDIIRDGCLDGCQTGGKFGTQVKCCKFNGIWPKFLSCAIEEEYHFACIGHHYILPPRR